MPMRSAEKQAPSKLIYAAVLCALLAWFGYGLMRAFVTWTTPSASWMSPIAEGQDTRTEALSASGLGAAQSPPARYDFLSDPFHPQSSSSAPIAVIGADAPETSLNLKLMGRRAGEGGTAILITPDRREAVYQIGDEIIDDVFLESVTEDFIVLSQNGQIERLSLAGNDRTGLTQAEAVAPQDTLGQGQALITANIDTLLSSVTLTRVTEDGQAQGYRVTSNSPTVDLANFGLKDGDIVTHIGAEDLTQGRPEFAAIARELSQTSQFDIEILRADRPMTITLGQ